jgi:hypothetical protein
MGGLGCRKGGRPARGSPEIGFRRRRRREVGGWVGLGRWERGEGNRGREKGGKKGGERKIAENEGRREGN